MQTIYPAAIPELIFISYYSNSSSVINTISKRRFTNLLVALRNMKASIF
jgi:hypothetical protein